MKQVAFLAALLASNVFAQTYVAPYVDKNGNLHEGHMRSSPNQRRSDNYNAENNQFGGVNPYTGQRGHQKDEYSTPPVYNPSSGLSTSPNYQQPNPYGNTQRRNRQNGLP